MTAKVSELGRWSELSGRQSRLLQSQPVLRRWVSGAKADPETSRSPVLKPECRANFSHCALRLRRVVRGSLQAEFGGHRLKETDCALSLWSVANVAQSQKSDGTGCNSRIDGTF